MSRVLVACEESQAVTIEFRKLGIEAFSCDILPCSGGHPEWHYQQDIKPLLAEQWDAVIAFPPCTDLASSGAAWFEAKRRDGRQAASIEFFKLFTVLPRYAIENPVGIMSSEFRKPDQIIQPYQFGDCFKKRTCLWLEGLPKLVPTKIVDPSEQITFTSGKTMPKWYADLYRLPPKQRAEMRSKTFPGIARAMAEQWAPAL